MAFKKWLGNSKAYALRILDVMGIGSIAGGA